MNINTRTGLREGFDERLGVPIVYQKGIGQLRFGGQITARHTAPYREGISFDFFARLNPCDELVVSFHGANKRDKNFYPMFWRMSSLKNKAPAMMAFADPTIQADPKREMLLSWYLGGPGWDPLHSVVSAIRKAQGKCGAKHIAFLGGSGGGFAALRASALVPGSLAFVNDPQTNIQNYIDTVRDKYFQTLWSGWDKDKLLAAFPERFDMVRHYLSFSPRNFVYYTQHQDDRPHMENHLMPFMRICGFNMENYEKSWNGARVFKIYKGEQPGHGTITANEFDTFYAEAFDLWRAWRAE